MIVLREYQEQCIAGLRAAFRQGYHSPLLVAPTGSGKTVMFSYLTGKLIASGNRVVLLAHRDELLDQISKTLAAFDVRHGVLSSGSLYDRRLTAHVAGVFTLVKRIDRVEVPDYVIVDEAHHGTAASTWGKVLAVWRGLNPKLRVIGVTATPERLSGEGLGETFDEMVLGPTTRELIDLGSLAEYRLFAPKHAVDLSDVGMRGGDYIRGASAAVMDKPAVVGDTIAEYRQRLNGAPTVCFEVSIENAQRMAERFRDEGFRAACLDGKMDKALRRSIVQDFARGQLSLITSCDLISEGFDMPGIVGAILRRPTKSLAMYLQQVGRALRTAPGKEYAIIVDQVGNSSTHGLPDDPRAWSLIGQGRGKKKAEGDVVVRECPACYAKSPASAARCRDCGKPFPVKSREIEEIGGQLSEVDIARARRQAAADQAAARTIDDLIALGQARGMKNPAGWARHVHAAREAKRARM